MIRTEESSFKGHTFKYSYLIAGVSDSSEAESSSDLMSEAALNASLSSFKTIVESSWVARKSNGTCAVLFPVIES